VRKPTTILAISDLHSQSRPLEQLDDFLGRTVDIDLVLVAGDITERKGNNSVANVEYLHRLLQIVKQKHSKELFAVHGNNDSTEIFNLLEATGVSLHLREKEFNGWRFTGIGGWGSLDETVLDADQAASFSTADSIFLTHIPPRFVGQFARPPLLHICGHFHSVERVTHQGGTKLVQLKTAMLGRGAVTSLPDTDVKFIDL
jgi:Icc-related predicted phosphoesterase